jgi:hypothetical protein
LGEVVNLRLARKRKMRDEDHRRAAENRAAHGRKKTDKLLDDRNFQTEKARLDGHLREKPDGE